MTVPQARSHGKTPPSEANSVAAEKRAANASRSRASARRRETILDAALVVAAAGGYEAVQMRTVAERVGIAVDTDAMEGLESEYADGVRAAQRLFGVGG